MAAIQQSDWKRPPIIEVVLGIQFEPLSKFNNGHLGWFWRVLEDYPDATDAAPIDTVVESFGDDPEFAFPGIKFGALRGDSRLRMTSTDGSRMVQVQNGWLVVNWVKSGAASPYPGYTQVLAEFQRVLGAFRDFVTSESLGRIIPNLWEVTYIDHIHRGTVWNSYEEAAGVVPGLLGRCASHRGTFESIAGKWAFRLQPQPGRLVVSLQAARTIADPRVDVLVVTSTARGPISKPAAMDGLTDSLNFGRSAVVETFKAVTSEAARAYWKG